MDNYCQKEIKGSINLSGEATISKKNHPEVIQYFENLNLDIYPVLYSIYVCLLQIPTY